jgi:proteic killer suppression protein
MITSFKCRDTATLFGGARVARFANIESVAMRKLQQLHAAADLNFLRIPPNNRLEPLKGNRVRQSSIRIDDQWRICFKFSNGTTTDVEIVDYH